jgi:hypothetical protein
MLKDEIQDIIEMNYDYNRDWLVDYVYNLYKENERLKENLITAKGLLKNTTSLERYNKLLKDYNKEVKKNEKLSAIKNR